MQGAKVYKTCKEYTITPVTFYRHLALLQLPLLGHKTRGCVQWIIPNFVQQLTRIQKIRFQQICLPCSRNKQSSASTTRYSFHQYAKTWRGQLLLTTSICPLQMIFYRRTLWLFFWFWPVHISFKQGCKLYSWGISHANGHWDTKVLRFVWPNYNSRATVFTNKRVELYPWPNARCYIRCRASLLLLPRVYRHR